MAGGIELSPVQVAVEVDLNDLETGVENMEDTVTGVADNIGRNFQGIGESFKNVGEKLKSTGEGFLKFGTVVTGAVGLLVKAGADWSAEVNGTQFLYNNLDKSIQNVIAKESKHANAIGITEQQYKNNATSISTYYKNMGFATKEIGTMSGKSMQLVADLAAVVDVPFDQAMGDFKSALMGNYEAVDKYGVNLSAATLENSAYVKGLGKSWSQLTDNEKMQAALNEITRQSAPMQGLASQEASEFGMQMKLLGQEIKETIGTIGEKLLPTLEPFIGKIKEVVGNVKDWVNNNPELTGTLLTIAGVVGVASLAFGGILVVFGQIAIGIGSLIIAFATISAPVALTVAAVVAVIVGLGIAVATNFGGIRDTIGSIMKLIGTLISTALKIIKKLWDEDFGGIRSITETIFNTIKGVVSGVMTAVQGVIKTITAIIKGDWKGAWEGVKQIFEGIWHAIGSFLSGALKLLVQIIVGSIVGFIGAISSITQGIYKAFMAGWRTVTNWWGHACKDPIGTLKNIGSAMYNAGKNVFMSIWNGMKGVWQNISSWVSDKVNWLSNKLSFWNSGKSKIDGHHYNGRSYIPFDGYNAVLHKGERVLTAKENRDYMQNGEVGPGGSGEQFVLKIENFNNNSPKDVEALCEEFYSYIKSRKK